MTFTATVSAAPPGSGTPSGTVTFYDGTTAIGTGMLGVGGGPNTATLKTSSLSAGTHTITASYGGNSNFTGSTMSTTQTVNPATTMTTVTSSESTLPSPGQVSFTAKVTAVAPGIGTPRGTVTFSILTPNDTLLSSDPIPLAVLINGADEATFTTTLSAPGTYTITAVYDDNNDNNFITSTSAVFTQTVK